jgi:hypothetical protein
MNTKSPIQSAAVLKERSFSFLKLFFLMILFIGSRSNAQNFNYTVSSDSVSWQELNSPTILNMVNDGWDFSYRMPIGFSFAFAGQNFDSLTIESNGYLVFDKNRNYAFTMFNQFTDRTDSLGNHSVLGYELSGSSGNHILKIQYKTVGLSKNDPRALSFQIWLKENGTIEVRTGHSDYHWANEMQSSIDPQTNEVTQTIVQVVDTTQYCRIGLLNMNMDTPVRGYFIGGDSNSPTGISCTEANPGTALLTSIPYTGRRYVFVPLSN